MSSSFIIQHRLINQQIASGKFKKPEDLVHYMGAVQSQYYPAAKWGLGLRLKNTTDNLLDKIFNEGKILRTHVLRPTWHFVVPEDIRWMLRLTAPRIRKFTSSRNRQLELNEEIFKKSGTVIRKALQVGKQLTRDELKITLEKAKIATNDQRLNHILMHAELDEIICSGQKKEKQLTYALLDERAPQAKILNRDEALTELAFRYFNSHGPATLQDYAWWSGLTSADAKKGLELNRSKLISKSVEGKIYWMNKNSPEKKSTSVFLLPEYDEYMVAYKDRSAALDEGYSKQTGNGIFRPVILINGQIAGTWSRTIKKNNTSIETSLFTKISASRKKAIEMEVNRYKDFLK